MLALKCTYTLKHMPESSFERRTQLLTEDEVLDLESVGSILRREAGHTFMKVGEDSDFVLLIRKGTVKVVSDVPERIFAFRGEGETVGEMGIRLDGRSKPRSASVVAWDDVTALFVSAAEWRSFLERHPRVKGALLDQTADRLEELGRKSMDSDLLVERRLAKRLTELVDRGLTTVREDGTHSVQLAQKALAALAESKLEAAKKAVRTFKTNGLIETGRGVLYIRDVAALTKVANGQPLSNG